MSTILSSVRSMVFSLLMVVFGSSAMADEYKLGSQDKVAIKIVEWQTVEGEVRNWDAVSGIYGVGPSGYVSIPLIGEIKAVDMTTAKLAMIISDSLRQKFGLIDSPEAAVEIVEYRPFYIVGAVNNPGQYPYTPGLTVLKALSISGGLRREQNLLTRASRDLVNAQGNIDILREQRLRLSIRLSRIIAQIDDQDEIALSEGIRKMAKADTIIADELAIKMAHKSRLDRQLKALDQLKELLSNEIISLEKQVITRTKQLGLLQDELANIQKLAQRGLTVSSRVTGVERAIADTQTQILDLQSEVLRAKQNISRATFDQSDLVSNYETELVNAKQNVDAQLAETARRLELQAGLLQEALSLSSLTTRPEQNVVEMSYYVIRALADGASEEIKADENTPVLPGDVVRITVEEAALQ